MAIKFKSKYTAQQIEQILDNISAAGQGSFIKVNELPDINEAATNQFYLLDGQMWYVNTDVTPREWEKLTSGGGNIGEEGLDTTEWEYNQVDMSDFIQDELNESYFYLNDETNTSKCFDKIRNTINEEDGNYYVLLGITGQGWLEKPIGSNEITTAASSYYITNEETNFFVLLTLVDGTQVKIILDTNTTNRYLINYIGYAL